MAGGEQGVEDRRSLRLFEGSAGQSGVETSEWGTENVT